MTVLVLYTLRRTCGYVCTLPLEEAGFCFLCLDFVPPAFLFVVLTGSASTFRGNGGWGWGVQIM